MAGRHGNKGIVSQVLPRQDMPFLANGTPIDMVLNPLGVPSRMNVGQIYECLLGLAAKYLGEHYKIFPFDEKYGPEASRSFVYSKLYEARKKTGSEWLFNPNCPGKTRLFDGRTGDPFDQSVTVGYAYMLKLVHLVDDKIHCLTPEHDVLTSEGWLKISEIGLHHQVATLSKTGELAYQNPSNIFHYKDYKGSLYHIKNTNIDLLVTLNHRMYVKKGRIRPLLPLRSKKGVTSCLMPEAQPKGFLEGEEGATIAGMSYQDYQLVEAKDIIGKHYRYLKNANWIKNPYKFILPAIISNSLLIPAKIVDMDAWLLVFGFWITEGCTGNNPIFLSSESIVPTLGVPNSLLSLASKPPSVASSKNPFLLSPEEVLRSKGEDRESDSSAVYQVQICQYKQRVLSILGDALTQLGYNYRVSDNKLTIHDKQLWFYLSPLSVGAPNKSLPSWVWELNQKQAQILLHSMCLALSTWREKSVNYYTSSEKLADEVMRLALHAGWSANKYIHHPVKNVFVSLCSQSLEGFFEASIIENLAPPIVVPRKATPQGVLRNEAKEQGKQPIIANSILWRISIIKSKNNPSVNRGPAKNQKIKIEEVLSYEGSVYCLSVPNEVFYVRRNGLPVWTGNSRSTGPYSLVTQQPLRGRSKQGGQRLGEMEVWALEGYGAAFTLLEMLTIKSDDMTGRMTLWSNLILNKDLSIGTPESFKVLVCELQALCLDIGIFRVDSGGNLSEIESLTELP